MNPCSPPSESVCLHTRLSAPCLHNPPLFIILLFLSPIFFFFFYKTNVILCINPASASLVDGINKCKNHKSLSRCLCSRVRDARFVRLHLFTRACTWLACVIGEKSISHVVAWKADSKLQHIYMKPACAAAL